MPVKPQQRHGQHDLRRLAVVQPVAQGLAARLGLRRQAFVVQARPFGAWLLRALRFFASGDAGALPVGVILAQGISSLFHHNQQPQVIEEIIEQPTPASDSGWGSGNQQYANSGSGIEDVGLDDDGFFSDDDSYV